MHPSIHPSSPSSLLTLCWYCMTPGISWSCKKSAKMMSADDNAAIEAEIAAVLEQELTEIAVVQNDANHNEDIICEETENQVEAIVEQVTPPEETNNAVGETAVTKSVEQEAAAAVTAVVVTCEESIQEKTQEESKVLGEAADVEEVKEPEPEPEEERAASQPVQEAENVMVVEEVVTLDQQSALQEESQQEQVTDEMQVDKEAAEQVESITAESVSPSIEQSQQQQQQPAEVENSTDGPRAKHLKQALRKALNNTIKSCR